MGDGVIHIDGVVGRPVQVGAGKPVQIARSPDIREAGYDITKRRLAGVERGIPPFLSGSDAGADLTRASSEVLESLRWGVRERYFSTSVKFPRSFVFKFPFRRNHKEEWRMWNFAFLRSTTVTYTIRSMVKKIDGREIVIRAIFINFSGASVLNNGFWGPFDGEVEGKKPYPEMRMDQIKVTELFDMKTGDPYDYYGLTDYDEKKKKIPFDVEIIVSKHNGDNGQNQGCRFYWKLFERSIESCVEHGGEKKINLNFRRQLYSIFENDSNLRLKGDPPGGVLAEARHYYSEATGATADNETRGVDLAAMMWYLWSEGLADSGRQTEHAYRLSKMEERL